MLPRLGVNPGPTAVVCKPVGQCAVDSADRQQGHPCLAERRTVHRPQQLNRGGGRHQVQARQAAPVGELVRRLGDSDSGQEVPHLASPSARLPVPLLARATSRKTISAWRFWLALFTTWRICANGTESRAAICVPDGSAASSPGRRCRTPVSPSIRTPRSISAWRRAGQRSAPDPLPRVARDPACRRGRNPKLSTHSPAACAHSRSPSRHLQSARDCGSPVPEPGDRAVSATGSPATAPAVRVNLKELSAAASALTAAPYSSTASSHAHPGGKGSQIHAVSSPVTDPVTCRTPWATTCIGERLDGGQGIGPEAVVLAIGQDAGRQIGIAAADQRQVAAHGAARIRWTGREYSGVEHVVRPQAGECQGAREQLCVRRRYEELGGVPRQYRPPALKFLNENAPVRLLNGRMLRQNAIHPLFERRRGSSAEERRQQKAAADPPRELLHAWRPSGFGLPEPVPHRASIQIRTESSSTAKVPSAGSAITTPTPNDWAR